MTAPRLVRAAGCIVWRYGSDEPDVLLVHRPRLRDWSFPKGKLERRETPFATAVREVEEETGLRVKLGPRLPDQNYLIAGGVPKIVHYWAARPPANADITGYGANDEVDAVQWCGLSQAHDRLTYPHDRDLLDTFANSCSLSSPLLIVRHGEARSRKGWRGEDSERPLKVEGKTQSSKLSPLFAAYGVTRLVSSDAVRCVDTVLPYANEHQVKLTLDPSISQDGLHTGRLQQRLASAMGSSKRIALCSHRPVLPLIFDALGVERFELEPAGVVVLHREKGAVVDQEVYPWPP